MQLYKPCVHKQEPGETYSSVGAPPLDSLTPVSVVNKYGVDAVLAPVVQQLKKLEQVINYISPSHLKFGLYTEYVYLLCMVVVL